MWEVLDAWHEQLVITCMLFLNIFSICLHEGIEFISIYLYSIHVKRRYNIHGWAQYKRYSHRQ